MSFSFRRRGLITGTIASLVAGPAMAQTFPNKPVRIVVPYAPGGGNDQIARALAKVMTDTSGWNVIVENRPGAGSMIGLRHAARSPADGYTLVLPAATLITNAMIYKSAGYKLSDFVPIAPLVNSYMILTVHGGMAAKTLPELIAYAKQNPGKLNNATLGPATVTALAMEGFRQAAGISFEQVPYGGGGPAMQAVMAGDVHMIMEGVATAVTTRKTSDRIRLLAISRPERLAAAPDVPTFAELGYPSMSAFSSWAGLFVPAGTPEPVVRVLRDAVGKAMATKALQDAITNMGYELPTQPEQFPARFKEQVAAWEQIIKTANIPQLD